MGEKISIELDKLDYCFTDLNGPETIVGNYKRGVK